MGELIRSMNNHTPPVHDLDLRPNDSGLPMLVSVGDDKTVGSIVIGGANGQVKRIIPQ